MKAYVLNKATPKSQVSMKDDSEKKKETIKKDHLDVCYLFKLVVLDDGRNSHVNAFIRRALAYI